MQAGDECDVIANPEAIQSLELEFKILNLKMGWKKKEKVTDCFKAHFYFPV